MKFNLESEFELKKADEYFAKLKEKPCKIELKKIMPKRTNKQNSYLHVLFSIFALDFGWNLEEAKTVIKRKMGLIYEKNGLKFLKSTSDLTTKEMSDFIEKFRNYSAEQGCYLPTAEEYLKEQCSVDNYIEKNIVYL